MLAIENNICKSGQSQKLFETRFRRLLLQNTQSSPKVFVMFERICYCKGECQNHAAMLSHVVEVGGSKSLGFSTDLISFRLWIRPILQLLNILWISSLLEKWLMVIFRTLSDRRVLWFKEIAESQNTTICLLWYLTRNSKEMQLRNWWWDISSFIAAAILKGCTV